MFKSYGYLIGKRGFKFGKYLFDDFLIWMSLVKGGKFV